MRRLGGLLSSARAAQVARAFACAALALACAGASAGAARAGALPDSAAAAPAASREGLLSVRDASRALFAAGAIAIVSRGDAHFTAEASRNQSPFARNLARVGEHIGNGAYSLPVLGGLWAYGHLAHRPALRGAALRIAGGAASGLVVVGGLKELVGRWRPNESPDDPYRYKAFSSHASFPSGHTAWAFALAAGVDRETSARWVPFVAYPLASVTAWSRVHDRKHWASDVTAAAIVGLWAEHKFAVLVPGPASAAGGAGGESRGAGGAAVQLGLGEAPASGGVGPAVTLAF